jgi:hypothetical protein
MMQLRGTIQGESEKAILFYIEEDICLHLKGRRLWFPKSKIKLPKRRQGIINIYVQDWLYDRNIIIQEGSE